VPRETLAVRGDRRVGDEGSLPGRSWGGLPGGAVGSLVSSARGSLVEGGRVRAVRCRAGAGGLDFRGGAGLDAAVSSRRGDRATRLSGCRLSSAHGAPFHVQQCSMRGDTALARPHARGEGRGGLLVSIRPLRRRVPGLPHTRGVGAARRRKGGTLCVKAGSARRRGCASMTRVRPHPSNDGDDWQGRTAKAGGGPRCVREGAAFSQAGLGRQNISFVEG
jgi:hypothetical protein